MKIKSTLISIAVLLFALSLSHESFAQDGKWKKKLRKAAAFAVGVYAGSQGEDIATAMEATTWALGGDEQEMSENANMADYTFQDLKEDFSYKAGETIVNMQEKKEQEARERARERARAEQYNNEYNNNYRASESFKDVNENDIDDATINSFISDEEPVVENNTADLEEFYVEESTKIHEYVDLGLPSGLKWATCNIGANVPEESGDYFAWGEITTIESTVGDYYENSEDISNISGNAQFDAATDNWGDNWRIPTYSEMQELLDKCTWVWTTQGGQNGYKVTGPNGNSIFLPAAGSQRGSSINYAGEYGYYWSSMTNENDNSQAYSLGFGMGYHYMSDYYRPYGRSVRPVTE